MLKSILARSCRKIPKKGYSFDNVKSVLIRGNNMLGDSVVHTADFVWLKKAFPEIKIGVLVDNYNIDIYKNCPLVDVVIKQGFLHAIFQHNKWQILIDYSATFTTNGLIFNKIVNPEYTICLDKDDKKHYHKKNIFNYDIYCKRTLKKYSESIKATPLGFVADDNISYCLKAPEKMQNPYHKKEGIINILVCIEGSSRILPLSLLRSLLSSLKSLQYNFVFLNSKHALEYYKELKKDDGLNIELAEKTDVGGFLRLIYFADCVFTVDSAAVHIASAYKKPMLALNVVEHTMMPLEYDNCVSIVPKKCPKSRDDYSVFNLNDISRPANDLFKKVLANKK